jgi:multiple sugar transport system permease protein
MVIYLAGLKAVDPTLREAAAIDGCNEWQAFRHVVFPALRPINVVVAVITVIEAMRAYDIIAALNEQRGTEVLAVLVTRSLLGEGSGRVGFGSAYGVVLLVLCIGFIIWYVASHFREREA